MTPDRGLKQRTPRVTQGARRSFPFLDYRNTQRVRYRAVMGQQDFDPSFDNRNGTLIRGYRLGAVAG